MRELLLIPGPTPVSENVLEALSRETISHTDDRFVKIFNDALANVKIIFGATESFPFIITGSGTLGMEMSLTNILDENENVLVISHGFFGDRFAELGKTLGANVKILKSYPGKAVTLEEIEKELINKQYSAITITHVDTSTGVLADIAAISDLVHSKSPNTLIVVDGVCATGGVEQKMDLWGVDVIFTGSQKAVAVPPGLTMMAFSNRAVLKRKKLGKMRTYYGDILRWIPIVEDPHRYFATPSVNMIFALQESLKNIINFGLNDYFEKHRVLSRKIRKSMEFLGFELLAIDSPAPTLSVFKYPEIVIDDDFRKLLASKKVILASALGELKGRYFRMGHMGSLTEEELFLALKKIVQVLEEMGMKVDKGKAFDLFIES
jgi:alanine-glyoxylate transaminase/serine-glyoxylate transaminase/serine-pyruvate transaminase